MFKQGPVLSGATETTFNTPKVIFFLPSGSGIVALSSTSPAWAISILKLNDALPEATR